jgi:uncharacterized protein (TIGR00251 family)
MIAVAPHAEGCVLAVRAQPGARKSGVVGEHAGALKLAVTAPPDRGRANRALVELLRELLDVRRSQVELLSGETSQDKRFLIRGLTETEVRARVTALLGS